MRADPIQSAGLMEAGMMGRPLSTDLRSRALTVGYEGMSCRVAASPFGVSASTNDPLARPAPPHRRLHRQAVEAETRDRVGLRRTATRFWRCTMPSRYHSRRATPWARLDGLTVAISTLHRFFPRHGIAHKMTGHAIERDRADVLSAGEAWIEIEVTCRTRPDACSGCRGIHAVGGVGAAE